jgi:hypothetical protein
VGTSYPEEKECDPFGCEGKGQASGKLDFTKRSSHPHQVTDRKQRKRTGQRSIEDNFPPITRSPSSHWKFVHLMYWRLLFAIFSLRSPCSPLIREPGRSSGRVLVLTLPSLMTSWFFVIGNCRNFDLISICSPIGKGAATVSTKYRSVAQLFAHMKVRHY